MWQRNGDATRQTPLSERAIHGLVHGVEQSQVDMGERRVRLQSQSFADAWMAAPHQALERIAIHELCRVTVGHDRRHTDEQIDLAALQPVLRK